MWYVVQVESGKEEQVLQHCQRRISEQILQRGFLPYYDELRKNKGKWTVVRKKLFPGYLFLVTEDAEALYQELKKILEWTKLLKTGDTIVPLSDWEVEFLLRFGGEEQVVGVSRGIIENDRVIVQSGPLKGQEGYIKKVDRHRRKAYLQMEMFGRIVNVQMSLEIVAKR